MCRQRRGPLRAPTASARGPVVLPTYSDRSLHSRMYMHGIHESSLHGGRWRRISVNP